MDFVLAKVKRLQKRPFLKLLSDQSLYEPLNLDSISLVSYNPDHNLDEDSWFKITEFSKQEFCIEILTTNLDSKDYDNLEKKQFGNISCLLSVQGQDVFFQKITPSLFLHRKMLAFGDAAFMEADRGRILVNVEPDAIYIKSIDTLIFRNLASISSVFKGIDQIYNEATDEEVIDFLKSPFISVVNGYDSNRVSKPNRKRIALVAQTLETMPEDQKADLIGYIGEYCKEKLTFNGDMTNVEIATDNDLKFVLYGIEQRFYTTKFGDEKRLANSIQALG